MFTLLRLVNDNIVYHCNQFLQSFRIYTVIAIYTHLTFVLKSLLFILLKKRSFDVSEKPINAGIVY